MTAIGGRASVRLARPIFVSVEGIEGAGKTTLVEQLVPRLAATGWPVVPTLEPGGTPLGAEIRRLVLAHRSQQLAAGTELLLFGASRAHLVATVIRPAVGAGCHVICDRFADSSIAYQGYGRGLPLGEIEVVNAIATGGLRPEATILLDLPAVVGLARKLSNERNRFEDEAVAFHERVRAGYRQLAAQDPARWIVCDATAPPDVVAAQVWVALIRCLDANGVLVSG